MNFTQFVLADKNALCSIEIVNLNLKNVLLQDNLVVKNLILQIKEMNFEIKYLFSMKNQTKVYIKYSVPRELIRGSIILIFWLSYKYKQ